MPKRPTMRPSSGWNWGHLARHWLIGLAACGLLLVPVSALAQMENDECFECHEDAEDEIEFPDGSVLIVDVDPEGWANSVHGSELKCSDCHTSIDDDEHSEGSESARAFGSLAEYQRGQADTCKKCHYAYYTRMVDSIHYAQLEEFDLSSDVHPPTCVDCHGSHNITSFAEQRAEINNRCSNCHEEIAKTYANSVHGKGLLEGNTDSPACTDCHGAHAIDDPKSNDFHNNSHLVCAKCHADEEMMEPYGLNTNVLDSYLDDFHGLSNNLYSQGAGVPGQPMATCSDCHGVHDIQPFDTQGSKDAMKERVVVVCQKCHEGAPPEFANAWLSHYEPSLQHAPLVWIIKMAYRVLIPLIILGLLAHILLHLWRLRMHRRS